MTDDEFLAAMNIRQYLYESGKDPLAEALRIDDQRSNYCEQLERRIEEQSQELEQLRSVLGKYLIDMFDWERAQKEEL